MNAELISDIESCERRGYWSKDFEPNKLHPTEMLRRAIAIALTDVERVDRGEHAGELIMGFAGERGLAIESSHKYDIAVHHAALADIVTSYLNTKGQYMRLMPKLGQDLRWDSWCLCRDDELVRIVLVDHWNEDRLLAESRSWFTLGEMAAYKMPMTLEVIILGTSAGHKRHAAWSKGLLHPRNRALRFKKKAQKVEGFKNTWVPIFREDHGEISREVWLAAMEADGVLDDVTSVIHVDRLSEERIREIRGIIERKTEKLYKIKTLPDPNYSSCDWPRPCPYRQCCYPGTQGVLLPDETSFRRREDRKS